MVKNASKPREDIVSFILFRRKLRIQLKRAKIVMMLVAVVVSVCVCISYKQKISNTFKKVCGFFSYIEEQFFTIKVEKVKIHTDKHSVLEDKELEDILKQFYVPNITKSKMQSIITNITETNPLIKNVYMKTNIVNNEVTVFLKEKQIVGIFYGENCSYELPNSDKCQKYIITANNQLLPYHKVKDKNEILKIYGTFSNANLNKIKQNLIKYHLLDNTAYLKFYSSGRFDLILTNKLILKLPRDNLQKSLSQFNKLNSKYQITQQKQNIKYIDLRSQDKAYIGLENQ